MLRSLFAAALAIALALGSIDDVHAQNNVLYGLIDASGSHGRPPGGDYQWKLDSGAMSRSYLGFRGSEDLGGGLRAVYRLESYLTVDTGRTGGYGGGEFWGRDANVGLAGAFGSTVLGRNVTPLYLTTITFNPFGESFGFSPSTRTTFADAVLGDRSWNNSVAYVNNPRDPLRVHIVANAREANAAGEQTTATTSAPARPTCPARSRSHRLGEGPEQRPVAARGLRPAAVAQLSATYDFKVVRLYGQLGRVNTDANINTKHVLFHIGAAAPIGQALILVAYGNSRVHSDFSQTPDRIYSIGYDYFVSRTPTSTSRRCTRRRTSCRRGTASPGGVRFRF
jgi:predicted porin